MTFDLFEILIAVHLIERSVATATCHYTAPRFDMKNSNKTMINYLIILISVESNLTDRDTTTFPMILEFSKLDLLGRPVPTKSIKKTIKQYLKC